MAGTFKKIGEFIGLTPRDDDEALEEEYYDEQPKARRNAQDTAPKASSGNVRAFRETPSGNTGRQGSYGAGGRSGSYGGQMATNDTNLTHQTVLKSLKSLDETNEAIDALLASKSVLVNMDGAEPRERQRMVDSLSGATYALRAKLRKVADHTYYLAPQGIGVQGEIKVNIPENNPALGSEQKAPAQPSIFRRGRVDE